MAEIIIPVLITGVISVLCTLITAKSTQDKVTGEIKTQNALQNNEISHIKESMAEMKVDIKSHNNYAKLFNENIPVLKVKVENLDSRISKLEQTKSNVK